MLITAIFKCETEAELAVDELELAGVDRSQIGILTTDEHGSAARGDLSRSDVPYDAASAGAAAGALMGGLGYLGAMSAAGAVILTGGGLGVALGALLAAGGASGVVGALVASGFHHRHAEHVVQELEAGGLTIWIAPRNAQQEAAIRQVLARHAAVHIIGDAAAADEH